MTRKRGAPLGNTNGAKAHNRPWRAAIERALEKRSLKKKVAALDALAEKLLVACDKGDVTALKELGDRMEGKSVQFVEGNIDTTVTVEITRFADSPAE